MSASHFLRHLAVAYNHFHPIDEHRKFGEQLDLFEKNQLRERLSGRLDALERRCRLYISSGKVGSGELSLLLSKVKELKRRLSGELYVLSHEGAPVV